MRRALMLFMSSCVAGCATVPEAPPSVKQTIEIQVLTSAKSNPNSVQIYQVPESSTFIAVRPNIPRGAHWVGGVVALAIGAGAYGMAKDRARDAIAGHERNLRVNVPELASAILDASIKQLGAGSELRVAAGNLAKGRPSLSLLPYIVLAYVSDSELRPFVLVDAVLKDEHGSEVWQTRYIGAAKEIRALTGDNGWSSSSGRPLREAVAGATGDVLDTAVRDLAGKLPRANASDTQLKTQWPLSDLNDNRQYGKLVESNDRTIVFVPTFKGVWFAGVYSIPRELADIGASPR